jgi:hypothetical protein
MQDHNKHRMQVESSTVDEERPNSQWEPSVGPEDGCLTQRGLLSKQVEEL